MAFAPLTPVIMATVRAGRRGRGGGVLQTMQQVGATLGLAVLVAVFGATVDGRPGTAAFVDGMSAAFTVSAGIIGAAFVVVAVGFHGRRRRGDRQDGDRQNGGHRQNGGRRQDGGPRQFGAKGHSS